MNLYDYAMGDWPRDGIACLSGDAMGFEGMLEPLSARAVEGVLRSALENEQEDLEGFDAAGLAAQINESSVGEIFREHQARFRASREHEEDLVSHLKALLGA